MTDSNVPLFRARPTADSPVAGDIIISDQLEAQRQWHGPLKLEETKPNHKGSLVLVLLAVVATFFFMWMYR